MELLATINGIDLALFVMAWLFFGLWISNKSRAQEPLSSGDQYFNDSLGVHLNCQMDITEYLCGTCNQVSYRLLRCNEASDCVDEAVGIAVEFEHDCH